MHRWDSTNEEWSELVVEDRHSTPADLAAFRVDFRAWLKTLTRQKRRITLRLCRGESTQTVARLFRLSAGRISQIRSELCEAWHEFHGEGVVAEVAT